MKNLSRLMFALLLVLGYSTINAQDENNPWQIGVGINAVDLYPVGENAPQGEFFDEFFNVNDHWNILPSISSISVSRYLGDNFSFGVAGTINRINKIGQYGSVVPSVRVDDLTYYGVDGTVKYNVGDALDWDVVEPFVGVGGGYTWVDEIGAGTFNGTLGINFMFTNSIGITAQSSYKHSFEDYLAKHFQHTLGLTIRFGGDDSDGDGINDNVDDCPTVFGLAEFNGCPDTDGDGLIDSKDACPNLAGLVENDGCPDTDGDGITDNKDKCPSVAGLASLDGCPDADNDGIADGDDNCPNEAGPSANNGCPWPDSDGDGILDKDDQCPNEAGVVSNNGCPKEVLPDEVADRITSYARTINFDTGKSTFKENTYPTLQAITAILKEYPDANFRIEGHTDSVGSESLNQRLSDRRANAVMDYLVNNGISSSRLQAVGYGESSPIESNKTREGRAANRRVEVRLVN